MAGAQITEVGAVWPPSILGIRQDIRIFRTPRPGPGVAATFMYRGQLDTSPAQAGSYSIFVMGEQVGEEVVPTYADFRRGSTDGKWAPRFLGQLDWDADGSDEVALELYGDGIRGFRLLERTSEGFVTSLEVACGPTAVGSAEAGAP